MRIAVRAAGVHLIDTAIRRGSSGPMPFPALPQIGGREVAGVVDQAGPGADPSWLGERVVAHLGMAGAGYAELPLCAQITADDVVVVLSAAGGLGTLLVQAARQKGVVVIGAAGGAAKVRPAIGLAGPGRRRGPAWACRSGTAGPRRTDRLLRLVQR